MIVPRVSPRTWRNRQYDIIGIGQRCTQMTSNLLCHWSFVNNKLTYKMIGICVLSHQRRRGEEQTHEDRSVITAIHRILLEVGITPDAIHRAGITGYGYNNFRTLWKLKRGIPNAVSGRRQQWSFPQVQTLQKHIEKYKNRWYMFVNNKQCPHQLICYICLWWQVVVVHFSLHSWNILCTWVIQTIVVCPALPIPDDGNAKWKVTGGVGILQAEAENINNMSAGSGTKG